MVCTFQVTTGFSKSSVDNLPFQDVYPIIL